MIVLLQLSSPVPSKGEQRKLKTSNFLKKGVLLNLSSSKFMNLSFETIAGGGGEKRIIQKTRCIGIGGQSIPTEIDSAVSDEEINAR